MKQDFRTGYIDVLNAGELSKALHEHRESWFSRFFREEYRGVNNRRIPTLIDTAASANFLLSGTVSQNTTNPPGPEQGFIWRVESLLFESSANGFTTVALQNVAVGATGVATANLNSFPVLVAVTGGTVTAITVNGISTGATTGTFLLQPGGLIATTNTGAPTYTTSLPTGTSLPTVQNDTATGILYCSSDDTLQNTRVEVDRKNFILGQRYYPSSKGFWIWPGEYLYVGVNGATVGNQYSLTGIVAEVPMEMLGKLV